MASRFQSVTPELDSSADMFGATPDASPIVTARQILGKRSPTKRIPSDPTDSGISDSGTKSKSVTPEDYRHRSPQVIYASDDDDDDGDLESGDGGDQESDDEHVIEETEDEAEESDPNFDESILVRRKKSKAAVIESDEEDDVSGSEGDEVGSDEDDQVSGLIQKASIISSDESGPDTPVQKQRSGEGRKRQNIIVSDDDSDEEADQSRPMHRNNKPEARSNQILSSDDSEEEESDERSQPVPKHKPSHSASTSKSKAANPWVESESSDSNISQHEDQDDSEVYLTPPPASDDEEPSRPANRASTVPATTSSNREEANLNPYQFQDTSVRHNVKTPPAGGLDDNIINVSSDDEDIQVVNTVGYSIPRPVGTVYKDTDINELENQIRKLKNGILANQHLLSSSGARLPDGGSKLRSTLTQDKHKMEKLRETLAKARQQLTSAFMQSGMAPQPPRMLKTLSGSNLPPIDNMPPTQQLEKLKKKKTEITNALKYSSRLSDGGEKMREKLREADSEIQDLEKKVASQPPVANTYSNQAWQAMKQNFTGQTPAELQRMLATGPGQSLYGGRMTDSRYREVKTVTHDAMARLHKSLETMPSEGDQEDQPRALKSSIKLFPHQKQALAWLIWREHQSASGGILADDMGLGKTLTMISLILKAAEIEEEMDKDQEDKENDTWKAKGLGALIKTKTTLIICPASLIGQWENEVKNKVKSGYLRVMVYHGAAARKATAREMARQDIIITTYGVILSEVKNELGDAFKEPKKLEAMGAAEELEVRKGKLLSLAFQRIILDEAHQIRNPKSLQSQAVCKLRAVSRWCVTGTPIQNKELDMYSLVRFLRCAPFDEYRVWKTWVENKSVQSQERMNTLIKSLLLRRTKDQKSNLTGKVLVDLPDKNIQIHEFELSNKEKEVYSEVEKFAKGAMEKFMDQKGDDEERRELGLGGGGGGAGGSLKIGGPAVKADEFAFKPYSEEGENVKVHHLLTLLLRMRQICCHPYLIKGMIDQETRQSEGIEEHGEELDLISQLEDMTLSKEKEAESPEKAILEMNNPVFKEAKASSKIQTVVAELRKLKERAEETGVHEKAVVVSQWTAMLNIIKVHIQNEGLRMTEITGQVAISARAEIVESFNKDKKGPQILLLSLAAGGVGLNLVGANHLFLLDMHWNPQLESQACDRIYRVGQIRDVTIHKFLVKNTVEERINKLQQNKLKLADDVLSGAKKRGANKLSLDDLKSLFNVA